MLGLSQANILWQTGFSGRVVQDHLQNHTETVTVQNKEASQGNRVQQTIDALS